MYKLNLFDNKDFSSADIHGFIDLSSNSLTYKFTLNPLDKLTLYLGSFIYFLFNKIVF